MYNRDGKWWTKITRPMKDGKKQKPLYFNLSNSGLTKKSDLLNLEKKLKAENRPGGLLFDNRIKDECLTVSGMFDLFFENSYAKAAKGKKLVSTVEGEKDQVSDLLDDLGDLLLPDVTAGVLEDRMARRLSQRSHVTVGHEMALMRRAFKYLREVLEITNLNPFRNIEIPSRDNPRDCFLFEGQARALLNAYKRSQWPWLHDLAIVARETGFRRSTLCKLKPHHLDFKERAIYIRRDEIKNKRSIYKPMSPKVYKILKGLMGEKVVGLDYVFKVGGKPINPNFITQSHLAVRRELAARVPRWAEVYNRFVFHGWRHQHSSDLAQSGADLQDIAEANGQSDLSTAKNYTHLQIARKRDVINQAFGEDGYKVATEQ